ncbi:Uncharacterised protein [Serratia ficaria]|uniref:hypothetical protein n=1 Tax=Serratia ficaria TaxID=61651 RepID=UPI0021826A41|nr:hypothetical protein [Serratia ficaria]CAI2403197.1 Uncharacterised protein [Serratia ficaria]
MKSAKRMANDMADAVNIDSHLIRGFAQGFINVPVDFYYLGYDYIDTENCGVYSDQAEKPALTQRDQTLVSSHAVSTGPKPSDSAGKLTAWPPLAKFIPF